MQSSSEQSPLWGTQVQRSDDPAADPLLADPLLVERDRLIRAYTKLGITLANQGDFEQAIAHFQKVLEVVPTPPKLEQARAHYNIGTLLVEQAKLSEAASRLQTALEVDPSYLPSQYQMAKVRYLLDTPAKGYQFTQDWFSRNVPIWQEFLQPYAGQPNLNALEVGSWEGRSACWLLEHVLTDATARLTCIDTFEGSPELKGLAGSDRQSLEARFDFNIGLTGSARKVIKQVGNSYEMLRSLPLNAYDLIYIDGSHAASDVLTDAVLCWGLLKRSGLLVFDDYDFAGQNLDLNVKLGADTFVAGFAGKLAIVHRSHQLLVRKTVD
jgi:tetratricopeptide (TPR) repeat protein